MAFKITKVDVWAAEIVDRPGGLDKVLGAVAGARGNLDCVIARRQPEKQGTGVVFASPVKGKAVQSAARSAGAMPAANISTLRIEGANRAGVGHQILGAISNAGVNVRGVSALTIGNKFAAYIGFDNAGDADKALKAIKASEKAPKAKARK